MSGLNERDVEILRFYAQNNNRELYWNYLAHKPGNDGYGVLALGVVRNDNMPGAVANHFADAEAKRAGVHLTERGWNRFGVDLMERDLAARADYLQRGRPDLALNLPAKDVMRVHDTSFREAHIPVNALDPARIPASRAPSGRARGRAARDNGTAPDQRRPRNEFGVERHAQQYQPRRGPRCDHHVGHVLPVQR